MFLLCKIVGLKIRLCKIFDKFQVCWTVWKISTQCHKFPVICPIVNMACMQKRFMQFWTFLSQKRITRSVWKVLLTGKF